MIKFLKNLFKPFEYGYTPIGKLDTSKPPLGCSGIKTPDKKEIKVVINVFFSKE